MTCDSGLHGYSLLRILLASVQVLDNKLDDLCDASVSKGISGTVMSFVSQKILEYSAT